jgi:predicted dinucleotide-utilizing enzyme
MSNKFNLIVAGGRDFTDYDLLKTTVDEYRISRNNIRIISGSANGADALAIVYQSLASKPNDL